MNENGSHWTLLVIDIQSKSIIYSDSFGHRANGRYVCYQIWRYLCFEGLIHSGILLDKNKWSIYFFCDSLDFPKQTDVSSCGVYTCAVAKAILHKQKLPMESNLHQYRKLMASEIVNNTLFKT